jgi:hypothetical protein
MFLEGPDGWIIGEDRDLTAARQHAEQVTREGCDCATEPSGDKNTLRWVSPLLRPSL